MMKQHKTTIKNVADYVGVSTASISYYLNGHYENLSEETVAKIGSAIKQLNYHPSSIARNLRVQHSKTIGLVFSGITGNLTYQSINGVSEYLSKVGYDTMIFATNEDAKKEREFILRCVAHRCEGIIIRPASRENYDLLKEVHENGIPVVMLSRCDVDLWPYDAAINDYNCVGDMMDYLHQKGIMKVAFFVDEDKKKIENVSMNKMYRIKVFLKKAKELFEEDSDSFLYFEINNLAKANLAIDDFVSKSKSHKMAIFSISTPTLLVTYMALQNKAKNIINNIELCGYGGADWIKIMQPCPVTLTQSLKIRGEEVAKLMIRRLQKPNAVRKIVRIQSKIVE